MKKTIIKVEHEKGSPPDIEINGKRLTSVTERVIFYVIVVLLALGAVWAIFYVLFPLAWFVLKLLLSIIGFGFIVIELQIWKLRHQPIVAGLYKKFLVLVEPWPFPFLSAICLEFFC
ncbi:MAG: hypothetical protein GY794_05990, partial [bacterium]|nr:hypothetical protein [bacterium]